MVRYRPTPRSRLVNGILLAALIGCLAFIGTSRGDDWWAALLLLAVAAMFVWGIGPQLYSFVEVGPTSVRVRRLGRTRTIPWESVSSCVYTSSRGCEDVILELHAGEQVPLTVLQTPAIFARDWRMMRPVRERIDRECVRRGIPVVRE